MKNKGKAAGMTPLSKENLHGMQFVFKQSKRQ
jgi:hypothetical protein